MKSKKIKPFSLMGISRNALNFTLFIVFLASVLISCSKENLDTSLQDVESADLKIGVELETTQEQLDRLTQKMRRFHNIQVAMAQGWDFDLTGNIPNMGHHYVNEDLLDGTFELLKPEALLYIEDENDNWMFVGVEYLVLMEEMEDPSTPPEGFIGDEDEWTIVGPFWTLHAWVGVENPDGVFNPTNSNVPE
ncbi:hypothetical protein NE848_05325 [Gramella jeungdoensis]|uniref:Uncharacterized protein n=1 Tax=Gramella jeungdoensis TaxID=708091 RepID=A0ABT0YZ97_9FLAO|nr:hypothetical protein [Gramella jeungdoensis]MCM8568788.1 hypothetical protein [Gramella jeungdoensis]